MPRISAPTLAEHRLRQRSALLDAARDLAVETDGQGVTFAAVAGRAGLARSSVYEYFSSPAVLLAHVVADDLARFADEINAKVTAAGAPEDRVRVFVRTWLRYIADGRHRVVSAVMANPLPEECVTAVAALHARITGPLTQALAELGTDDPERAADYVRGIVDATARRIGDGQPARKETAAAEEFVLRGLTAPA